MTLMVSTRPDRSNPVPLNGTTLTGKVAIFLPPTGVSSVDFTLYTPATVMRRTSEKVPPFDLYGTAPDGTAVMLDLATTPPGTLLTVTAVTKDSTRWRRVRNQRATFTIGFPTPLLGISPGAPFLNLSDTALAADLNRWATAGCGIVRVDLLWPSIQPSKGQWAWSNTDRVITAIHAAGMLALPILTYHPGWTHTEADYAALATAAAARYSPDVTCWEVWNEPNLTRNFTQDPALYTRYTNAAYDAIHAVDPTATVIAGSLSPSNTGAGGTHPVEWVTGMYAAGARFDALSIHPYSFPLSPAADADWSTMTRAMTIRALMDSHGDHGKALWFTEWGAPTNGPGAVTETQQAEHLAAAITRARTNPGIGPLLVYCGYDQGADPTNREHWFGLWRADRTEKPALTVYRAAT